LVLFAIGLATCREMPMFQSLLNDTIPGPGPDFCHFAWINGFHVF